MAALLGPLATREKHRFGVLPCLSGKGIIPPKASPCGCPGTSIHAHAFWLELARQTKAVLVKLSCIRELHSHCTVYRSHMPL